MISIALLISAALALMDKASAELMVRSTCCLPQYKHQRNFKVRGTDSVLRVCTSDMMENLCPQIKTVIIKKVYTKVTVTNQYFNEALRTKPVTFQRKTPRAKFPKFHTKKRWMNFKTTSQDKETTSSKSSLMQKKKIHEYSSNFLKQI